MTYNSGYAVFAIVGFCIALALIIIPIFGADVLIIENKISGSGSGENTSAINLIDSTLLTQSASTSGEVLDSGEFGYGEFFDTNSVASGFQINKVTVYIGKTTGSPSGIATIGFQGNTGGVFKKVFGTVEISTLTVCGASCPAREFTLPAGEYYTIIGGEDRLAVDYTNGVSMSGTSISCNNADVLDGSNSRAQNRGTGTTWSNDASCPEMKFILHGVSGGVFLDEVSDVLRFRQLVAGNGIGLTATNTSLTFTSNCNNTGSGEAVCESSNNINSLIAGTGVTIVDTTGDLTISSSVVGEKQIGQQQIFVHDSETKTNIGTSYVDVWVTLFDMEEMVLIHPNNVTYFYVTFQYDYVGAGTQQCRFVNTQDNTDILYESPTFTADQNSHTSGWFSKPAWATDLIYSIEMQCKSTTATDDPIVKGYIVYAK